LSPFKSEQDSEKENRILKAPPSPSPFPGSTSLLFSLPPSPAAWGDGQWGLWSAHHTLSLPLLPPHTLPLLQRGVPPMGVSSPQTAPAWVLPTGCSSSRTAPVWGPFHGVQSLRNRLPQRGSPTGSQALPANLLRCGLLSPRGRRSCQEPAPAWAPQWVTPSFGHPPALA